MTQASPAITTRPRTTPRAEQPPLPLRLRVIPARTAERTLPFLLLVGGIVVAGVLGLSALNVAVNQQAFRISELTAANNAVEQRYSVLQAEVDTLRAPARIAAIARERGLQPVTRARIEPWPRQASPSAAAPSPAAAETPAGGSDQELAGHVWTPEDPFPLKHYLAQR